MGIGWFLFKLGDDASRIDRDAAVFLNRLKIPYIIDRQRGLRIFCGSGKINQGIGKQIIATNHNEVLCSEEWFAG